jgi:hypothetical protein
MTEACSETPVLDKVPAVTAESVARSGLDANSLLADRTYGSARLISPRTAVNKWELCYSLTSAPSGYLALA